jgi:hypothetical protein
MIFEVAADSHGQTDGQILVTPGGRGRHVMDPIDDLVPHPVFGHPYEIVVGKAPVEVRGRRHRVSLRFA